MKLTVSRIRCSGCGAPYSVAPGSQVAICPFCDSKSLLGGIEDAVSTELEARQAAPHQVSELEFRARLLEWMATGDYTPEDIFEKARLGEQRSVWLPWWRIDGQFHAHWRGKIGYDRVEKTIIKTRRPDGSTSQREERRTVTDWRRQEGEASGPFALWAYAGESLSPALHAPLRELVEACEEWQPLDELDLGEVSLEEFALTAEEVRNDRGADRLRAFVKKTCVRRAPGDRQESFEVDFTTRDEVSQASLFPAWLITFRYDDEVFPVAVSGVDVQDVCGRLPVDDSFKSQVDALYTPVWWTLAGGGLLSLVGLCAGVVPGIIGAMATAGVCFWLWSRARDAAKGLIAESIARREQAAADAWEKWRAAQPA